MAGVMLRPLRTRPRLLPQKQRQPITPGDWGLGMTVCIAAISDGGDSLVTASDRMYSWGGETSGDGRIKTQRIHRKFWSVMLSGDDVRRLEPVIIHAQHSLMFDEKPTLAKVKDVLNDAWGQTIREIQERTVLSPYGYDRPTFLANGRAHLGEVKFNEVLYEMQLAGDLGCELLAYGFDEWNDAKLLTITGRGGLYDCSRIGFWAIGSGARSATDALFLTKYKTVTTARRAVYAVAHAKFMSERAIGVGKSTFVVALRKDGQATVLADRQMKTIREDWYQRMRPKLPKDAENSVPELDWAHPQTITDGSIAYPTPAPPEDEEPTEG
jgi:hypothetical protein